MNTVSALNAPPQRRLSRAALLGLVAVFFGPLALATLWYAHVDEWGTWGRVNHGELMQPVRTLEGLRLGTPAGEWMGLAQLRGHWTLIYVAGSPCALECEATLFKMRQAHLALGKEADRLQRMYIASDPARLLAAQPVLAGHPQMRTGFVAPASRQGLDAFGDDAAGYAYVVDPLGNVVMRYGDAATTKGMLKDLKRLLKVSQIG